MRSPHDRGGAGRDPRGEVSHAIGRAIVVYGDFVSRADKVVKLGMKQKVTELRPLLEQAVEEANAGEDSAP